MERRRAFALVCFLVLLASPARAGLREDLGDAVKDGDVRINLKLMPGLVPLNPSWGLKVLGETDAAVLVTAQDGKLNELHFHVPDGTMMIVGHGLYPSIVLEDIDVEGKSGITGARFRGRGFGRLVVSIFRGTAMKAVRKMRFQDDLASLFRGEILVPEEAAPPAVAAKAGRQTSTAPPAAEKKGPSLFDLVRTLEIRNSELTAFGGRRLSFEPVIVFAAAAAKGDALRVKLDSLSWSPARGNTESELAMDAAFDGNLAGGGMSFHGDRLAFSRGRLQEAHLVLHTAGETTVSFSARDLALTLTSGRFLAPGGIRVEVAEGSTFSAKDFRLAESGKISGVLDLDVRGETGEWERSGTSATMESVALQAKGLELRDNEATGPVSLEFNYRLEYPLVVRYSMPEIAERRVNLDFHGTLDAKLGLENAGGPEGRIRGQYSLRVPWAPVEKAALEVLHAKWTQDVSPAFRHVDFQVDAAELGPSGESCFPAKLKVTVDKKSGKTDLFHQECAPQGMAKLQIVKEARSVRLHDVKIEPPCRGALGGVVNLVGPLFTKAYTDVTVLKIPESFPLSIDEVNSGNDWIALAGKVDWEKKGEAP